MTRHQNTNTIQPLGQQPGALFARSAGDRQTGEGTRADTDFLRRWHDPYAPERSSGNDGEDWRIGDLDSGRGLALAVISVVVVVALLLGVTLAI